MRRSREARHQVPTPNSLYEVARRLVADALRRGAFDEQDRLGADERRGLYLNSRELDPWASSGANELLDECSDPLDLASSVDKEFYLALDRERAERELRMNAALPLLAIFVAIACRATLWGVFGAGVCALALFSAVREPEYERLRVLRFLSVKGAVTGALRRAEHDGRDRARELLERLREERDRREAAVLTRRSGANP